MWDDLNTNHLSILKYKKVPSGILRWIKIHSVWCHYSPEAFETLCLLKKEVFGLLKLSHPTNVICQSAFHHAFNFPEQTNTSVRLILFWPFKTERLKTRLTQELLATLTTENILLECPLGKRFCLMSIQCMLPNPWVPAHRRWTPSHCSVRPWDKHEFTASFISKSPQEEHERDKIEHHCDC